MTNVTAKPRATHNIVAALICMAAIVVALSLLLIPPQGVLAQPEDSGAPPDQKTADGESAGSPGHSGLLRKAEHEGSVRVIVGLKTGFTPEGRLSRSRVAGQRKNIATSRSSVLADLRGKGYRTMRQFETLPYVALELSPEALEKAQNSPNVTTIHEDIAMRPALAESGPIVQAPEMWAAGFGGSGQTIAVLDTGVDSTHPFLSGKVVKVVNEACYSAGSDCPNGSTSQVGAGSGAPCTYADGCAHGTHVAGIAAGSGSDFSGVARNASIMSIQVFSERTGTACQKVEEDPCPRATLSDQIAGLERVYNLRFAYDISSVNVSIGGDVPYSGNCDAQFGGYKSAIDNLKSVGIATVISSGNGDESNKGYTDAVAAPACISSAVTVGATNDSDHVTSFSNMSSTVDLLAPGDDIESSVPGGGFALKDGTSQAAPHVAGAWALLKQQNPSASVGQILSTLKSTGKSVKDNRALNGVTKPRINIAHASTLMSPLANDHFADARGLIGGTNILVRGKNGGATRQTGEPDHLPGSPFVGEHSLWYRWTPDDNGRATFNTCASNFDTALAVYTGRSLGSLTRTASDDDSCPDTQFFNGTGSKVTFDVTEGSTYWIAVSGRSQSQQGNFSLTSYYVAPTNDAFAGAKQLGSGTQFTRAGSNFKATREPGEPDHMLEFDALSGEHSVWYEWTAPQTGEVTINTCVSEFDTLLNVYAGDSLNALSLVARDDDSCPFSQDSNTNGSTVTFDVTEGTSYKIAIYSYIKTIQGDFDLAAAYTG